jgi:hypothetical protein
MLVGMVLVYVFGMGAKAVVLVCFLLATGVCQAS